MKTLLLIMISMNIAYAGLFSESARDYAQDLAKIGDRIVRAVQEGKPVDWSCQINKVNYCKKEKVKIYDNFKREIEIKGSDLQTYLNGLKKIEQHEQICLGKDNINYLQAKTEEEMLKLAQCLKKIKYSFNKPKNINYFGFDPNKIFNSKNRDALVSQLENKAHNIQQEKIYKEQNAVENHVVSNKEFKEHQRKIKENQKKYNKFPPIPSSITLISSNNKAKTFRILIEAEKTQNTVAFNGGYSVTYMNFEDTGFMHSGKGHYMLTCKSKKCFSPAYWETETYTANDSVGTFKKRDVLRIKNFEAIVKYSGEKISGVNGLGQKIMLPVLTIIEIY